MAHASVTSTISLLLLCAVALAALASAQSAREFSSDLFVRTEKVSSTGAVLRTMPQNGTFEYDSAGTNERWRLTIPFNGRLLEEIRLWEDWYLRYTLCSEKCGFEDKFVEDNDFPIMYANTLLPYTGLEDSINGFPKADIRVASADASNNKSHTDEMYFVEDTNGNWCPTRIVLLDLDNDRTTVFDFFNCSGEPVSIPNAPGSCTEVDPGCFRIDIWFGLDFSGSVGGGVSDARSFVTDFAVELTMAPDRVRIGVGRYDFLPYIMCYIYDSYPLLSSCVGNNTTPANGYTGTAHTIAMGLKQFIDNGRKSARKVQFIVTDGVYNQPCADNPYVWDFSNDEPEYNNMDDGSYHTTSSWQYSNNGGYWYLPYECVTKSGKAIHYLYDVVMPQYPYARSTQYAIGVGNGIDSDLLFQIAQNTTERSFSVTNYAALNTIIDSLVSALACEIPPTALCPNDCLPGGFCCGQSCECTIDCNTQSNDCQQSSCIVTPSSTSCVFTTPDSSFCTATTECTEGRCVDALGCVYDVTNATCDDGNPCSTNDRCTVSGCQGEPNINATCATNKACTYGLCDSLMTCKEYDVKCVDDNPDDCLHHYCDTTTSTCATQTIADGFQCRDDDPDDPCTVFVCTAGQCLGKTRDSSECQDDEGVSAGAVGGGVAGGLAIVALAALALLGLLAAACVVMLIIAAIAAIIIILALVATAGVGVQTTALATAVEGNMDVQVNPGHIEAVEENVSPLFEE